ncbi:hypothetical protein NIES2135_64570 (plasmid) [Leptolyngbya boryana NIES-2135]|jgi:hypothetical protein|uniref:DUF3854 domain-containing protein n=1 Tax=Leptolyngbya boryana NIES-2135 TaxID=1973484 RepID=A0A1Z4JSC0_LEPBY|nr:MULTISPECIES: plasmid replication protein, CyRepA1 family [Leptolyngbya]BAY59580.1 hypothetical protein NIES2135_64570 [Leptolyngbya boryana NIES-2135]MBD2371153.1 DUF3854 domain-containing protein [Leptolyngbya sp. FACHB-161]MBD2377621.1 DUF3854 domain-containing protein [Leptolyngbya sp. FACHB-238]MBD2402049.1 DUF3854 domain-containing protein [Leptolyngbya sp. FACHB-239]MBD2408568.1 DUF3854 domain-containing protein [Leptolyngbya sp. FACHB-402]
MTSFNEDARQSQEHSFDAGILTSLRSNVLPSQEDTQFESSFADVFRRECLDGSAIAPELFESTIKVVSDIQVSLGGDVESPIADALNWVYKRFGNEARPHQMAALFTNEDGTIWQAKLETPCFDREKGKPRKYETPIGNGSRAFLPTIPASIRDRISARYHVEIPQEGSFWTWLEARPNLPIIWTEGAKKALALLTQGHIAISLYGVNGGYRRLFDGSRALISDVIRFCQVGRPHFLAFDQDESPQTRQRVGCALIRYGNLLEATQSHVSVMTWKGAKGIDDLIVAEGIKALETAYTDALKLCHWKLEHNLFHPLQSPVARSVNAPDLSSLSQATFPQAGIVAFVSPKGSGKTKLLRSLVETSPKVLSATFRIALGRNLANRVGLDWRGDLDKVNGSFITGTGYTLRVGFCVDSLLAIDPEQFQDCDLIIDECIQVVRHLLTSSTCAKDGKRPALLARFRELLKVAKRVFVADADLNDAVLNYLQDLRGDSTPPFIVRNDYQPDGFPVTLIEAPDRTAVTQKLIDAISDLPTGQTIFVATDSKATSQAIAQILDRTFPEKRVLVINSETSGGQIEREFIEQPDRVLTQGIFDVIISSPSMATGVSIEIQGVIREVYGIFTGVAGTDADLSQALSRVREPVPRTVWCTRIGSNFSKVSRATHRREVKKHLFHSTSAMVRLIRSNLREDTALFIDRYSWDDDPHLNLFCELSANQNAAMYQLRDALYVRLRREGNAVTVCSATTNLAVQTLFKETRKEQREQSAIAISHAQDLSFAEIKAIQEMSLDHQPGAQSNERISPEHQQAMSKFHLKEFYGLETVTPEDVLWDQDGKRRVEITSLEVQLEPSLAQNRSVKSLEQQAVWGKSLCAWDLNQIELRRALREELGITKFVDRIIQGAEWTKYDLSEIAQKAREAHHEVKIALHFSINATISDTQIVHELLLQLCLKATFRWSRSVAGHEGEKLKVYSLNSEHWQKVEAILERRKHWRDAGSPLCEELINDTGDPDVDDAPEPECELLEDAQEYGEEVIAILWRGMRESVKARILPKLPPAIMQIIRNVEAYPLLYQATG